ncbi:MAG: pyruvate carboxylase subunit B [Kiritimatiellae bacterium]|nr:pyruvate carboxylase subunit B [Kiritimatiellia bacterium]
MKKTSKTRKKRAAGQTVAGAKPNQPASEEENLHKIPLRITDTTLRDAHQSLWATRMRTADVMGIIEAIDSVGYYSLEMWGGATFDVCMRFLRENPWERLRQVKAKTPNTPLQMLLRGQNVLGYKNYADDLLDRFVALACENGMDIFRIFDALNDTRNLEQAIRSVKKYGGHAQGTICYTISPFHTVAEFVRAAREQVEIGIDSLCIKDMAGILSPISAERLISALVKAIDVPIQMHCHASSGMATATYVEGVRAGAGAIDCSISPMAGFSAQPPVETLLAIFDETSYHANLNKDALREQCRYFVELAKKRRPKQGPLSIIDPEILQHQIPGGMISNLRAQLEEQNALDRLDDVLAELPRTRADLGFPPLVTPTSQIVGIQSVINVLSGKRFAMVTQETKNYVKGLYGRPPARIKPAIVKQILGNEKPITCRPADLLEPMLPQATEGVAPKLIQNEEDILSYCLFPEQALGYFEWRALPPEKRPPIPADLEAEAKEEPAAPPKPEAAGTKAAAPPAGEPLLTPADYGALKDLLQTFNKLGLGELSIARKGVRVRLSTGKMAISAADSDAAQTADPEAEWLEPGPVAAAEAEPEPEPGAAGNGQTINAPLNGTLYRSPGPGKPTLANEGDEVEQGAAVCIVEAMKLFNEITAPCKCRLLKFLVEHGQPVKKDDPLVSFEMV